MSETVRAKNKGLVLEKNGFYDRVAIKRSRWLERRNKSFQRFWYCLGRFLEQNIWCLTGIRIYLVFALLFFFHLSASLCWMLSKSTDIVMILVTRTFSVHNFIKRTHWTFHRDSLFNLSVFLLSFLVSFSSLHSFPTFLPPCQMTWFACEMSFIFCVFLLLCFRLVSWMHCIQLPLPWNLADWFVVMLPFHSAGGVGEQLWIVRIPRLGFWVVSLASLC